MEVGYKLIFIRQFGKLVPELQDEVENTIRLLKDSKNHKKLKVRKLRGGLKDCYSCSVNYSHRILFVYEGKKQITLIAVGDHSVYQ
jgi:mRNA-degrading endonuclease YafQ of YafQ-DinJ toxin-antitoxin module